MLFNSIKELADREELVDGQQEHAFNLQEKEFKVKSFQHHALAQTQTYDDNTPLDYLTSNPESDGLAREESHEFDKPLRKDHRPESIVTSLEMLKLQSD